jgi:hypothetical protein
VGPELRKSLLQVDLSAENVVYDIPFRNFIGDRQLRYGEWGNDHHIRLFNRKTVNWDDAPVHEQLQFPQGTVVRKMKGLILHQTVRDIRDYARKMCEYAMLNAEKYFRQGRRASWFSIHLSPGIKFIHYYFFRLGFLDGHAGYLCAKMTAYYTFLKYARLRDLRKKG